MGWLRWGDEAYLAEHEGYLVGVVRDGFGWRELGVDDVAQDLDYVQVGCECGWRSPRVVAPLGTRWVPSTVVIPDSRLLPATLVQDAAAEVWGAHVDQVDAGTTSALTARARDLARSDLSST